MTNRALNRAALNNTASLNNVVNTMVAFGFAILFVMQPHYALGLAAVSLLAVLINIAVHETGHAVVGWLVGHRVLAVVTGLGPRLLKFRVLGADIEWRLFPMGGYTVLAAGNAVGATLRFRYALAIAAGPAASALVAVAAPMIIPADIGFWIIEAGQERGISLASATRTMAIWLVITNLFPRPVGTDGSKLMAMFSDSDRDIDALGEALETTESVYRFRDGDYDAAIAASANAEVGSSRAHLHSVALCEAGQWTAARDALQAEVVSDRLSDEARAIAANNLAWAQVHLDEPGALAQADVWSAFAIEHQGDNPVVRGTRGRVLLELGRFDEALATLPDPHGERRAPAAARAQTHATRALALVGAGNAFGARADADAAWRLASTDPFVQRAYLAADEGSVRLLVGQIQGSPEGAKLSEAMAGPAGEPLRAAARRWLSSADESTAVRLLRSAGWPTNASDAAVLEEAARLTR